MASRIETEMLKCYICAVERASQAEAHIHEIIKHHGDITMYPLSQLPEYVRMRQAVKGTL